MEETGQYANRFSLGEGTTRFGLPRTKIDFTLPSDFQERANKNLDLMEAVIRQMGYTVDKNTDRKIGDQDGHHTSSTCRMGKDPTEGVVDADLKVFGTDNLYVCSNAAHPTCAAVNPTLTLVAVTLKLTDHLLSQTIMNKQKQSLTELLAEMHHLERMHLLLKRPKRQRNLEWLEHALQSAVSVEFSTIPPYLSALWSIKDPMHPVAASIRNVVQEEMLHMALACNMLTGLGCVPKINDPKMVPSYPGKIPGGVHPELTVSLSGLSDASLDAFIAIEAPSEGKRLRTPEHRKGYKTIGAFYQRDPRTRSKR